MAQVQLQRLEALQVSEIRDRASFVALQPEWDALVSRTDDQLFYRHDFFRLWMDHFAPHGPLRILTARDDRGDLVAALPLVETRGSILGVPVRQLSAAANAHSPRFDL